MASALDRILVFENFFNELKEFQMSESDTPETDLVVATSDVKTLIEKAREFERRLRDAEARLVDYLFAHKKAQEELAAEREAHNETKQQLAFLGPVTKPINEKSDGHAIIIEQMREWYQANREHHLLRGKLRAAGLLGCEVSSQTIVAKKKSTIDQK